jgi:MgtE intracellular N domain
VLPQMPTKHVVAMLLASKPAQAAAALLAMTPDRIDTLLAAISSAKLSRIVRGAGARDQVTLLATMSPTQRHAVLSELSTTDLVRLLGDLPPDLSWAALRDMPPRVAAGLLAELPAEPKRRLENLTPQDLSVELASALYERRATETVVRAAESTTRLDADTGDLRAELFGAAVQIAVRYLADAELAGPQVAAAAGEGRWGEISGLLVVTNARLSDSAQSQAAHLRQTGTPVDLIRWLDTGDDGTLKKALVRLAGRART